MFQAPKTFAWTLIALALLAPVAPIALAQGSAGAKTSANDPALRKWFKKQPQADANGDGVLTEQEALAFRKGAKSKSADESLSPAQSANARATAGNAPATSPTLANVAYGPHLRNVLDFWKAVAPASTPVLVYFHGGSFKAGDKSNVLSQDLFRDCLDAGVSVVSANYRFSSDAPFPAPMRDGARAVQFVRFKAKEWGLDQSRVALAGGSAGGTMALWIALHDDLADAGSEDPVARQTTRVRGVVARGAPAAISPEYIAQQTGVEKLGAALLQLFGATAREELDKPEMKKLVAEASPLTHATADDPPLLVAYHGEMSDAPFATDELQKSWIHHVCLGMPLKEKYDALGLDFQLHSQSNPLPDKAEIGFLAKVFNMEANTP